MSDENIEEIVAPELRGLSSEEVAQRLREAGWDILRTRQSEGWFSYLCR